MAVLTILPPCSRLMDRRTKKRLLQSRWKAPMRAREREVKKVQFLLIPHSYGPSKLCPPPQTPLAFLLHSPPHQLPREKHLPKPKAPLPLSLRHPSIATLKASLGIVFRSANLLREGIGRVEENNQLRELENVASHLCADSVKRKRVTE